MMKIQKNDRGAALMIALLAAITVMMAVTLLISLTRRMVDSHIARMEAAQISLSESSAADGLAFLISQSGVTAATEFLSFDLAGVTTEFTLVQHDTAPIRTGFFSIEEADKAILIPSGNRLVSVVKIDDFSVQISFLSGETFNVTSEFVLNTDMHPVAGTSFMYQGREAVILVLEGDNKALLAVVTSEGIHVQTVIASSILSSRSRLSAGEANGAPMLIVSSGANRGILYDCESGSAQNLTSPIGTCPVFLPDGSIFGSHSQSNGSFGIANVVDAFSGDFNSDGRVDMAFATRYSLTVHSGATGDLIAAHPGGSLESWGSVGGRTGLCGLWKTFSGERQWMRLGYDGFTDFTPPMTYELGWQSRFQGLGNTLTGFIDNIAVVAYSSESVVELLAGEIFIGDADGGETDYFQVTNNGVEACFNPVNGHGVQLSFTASNRFRGKTTQGETYIFSVYESDERIRVFHTIEGLDL